MFYDSSIQQIIFKEFTDKMALTILTSTNKITLAFELRLNKV